MLSSWRCLREWIAAGTLPVPALVNLLKPILPGPAQPFVGLIADVIDRAGGAIRSVITGCGYWGYVYVLWLPPWGWFSCSSTDWGGWIK